MKTITYSLRNNQSNSDNYYNKIAEFTDKVFTEAENSLSWLVNNYISYLSDYKKEYLRSRGEYFFDFLTLGIVWTQYINASSALSKLKSTLLIWLYEKRRNNGLLKPAIDFIRGILSTLWLMENKTIHPELPSIEKLNKLILWMKATGEFREEVKRIELIYDYFKTKKDCQTNLYIDSVLQYSEWFEAEGINKLFDYTYNVDVFLRTNNKKHLMKEDVIFCGRKKVEYLLSMVGAEIMNRAFNVDFTNSTRKALLLPACMKIHQDNKCKAKKISLDYVCTGCTFECRINNYRRLGIQKGFEVHIIPHSSSFTEWLQKWAVGNNIGVIGVACPLNLITGGLELKSLGIPAQCVLLDYCGCKSHWDEKGISTDLNENQLMKMFEKNEIFCK